MRRRSIAHFSAILILVPSIGCGKPQRTADDEKTGGDGPPAIATVEPESVVRTPEVLPPGFPADVPIVPGAAIVSATSRSDAGGRLSEVSLTTASRSDVVIDWYRRTLPQSGWIVVGEDSENSGYALSAAQGPSSLELTVESVADSANLRGSRVRATIWKIE